jgi:hypothetical protein
MKKVKPLKIEMKMVLYEMKLVNGRMQPCILGIKKVNLMKPPKNVQTMAVENFKAWVSLLVDEWHLVYPELGEG